MQINLHLLRIFFAVAERRSFSRAAETLFISQPAVSKAVRELERQLDLPLLERGTAGAKGVRLTSNGVALFDHARGIFALERAATEDIRARVGLKRGRLSVGASTTIAGYWLPPYTAAFCERFSSIELKIGVGNTQSVSRALVDCEVDVALVEGAVNDPRIVAAHWRDDRLRIVAHPGAALARRRQPTVQELNDQVWLVRESGSGTREVTERMMRDHGISPTRTIELGSNEGIARAVASGLGVAMLPGRVLGELITLERVKALNYPNDSSLVRPLFLLQLKERPASPLVRAFCEGLQRRLEQSR
ncbi:MAG TPA: LysR substrate-binding domain-containing protein [Burkholderiaceae bacterium]|nr:LysR substrate-binding domain-containing protein [Burkholderiaceae bacterium]